jgi:acyl-CoA dehydrogenase
MPCGKIVRKPNDNLIRELGELIMEENPVRQLLAQYLYVSHDPQDAAGRVESTYQLLLSLGPVWNAFLKAKNTGKISGATTEELAKDAAAKNIIQPQDVARIVEYDARRFDCLLTDAFDKL